MRLRCPQCSCEWETTALPTGFWLIRCPACKEERGRKEYMVVESHTCANCQFRMGGRCNRVMIELAHSGHNGIARNDFFCSLWKEKTKIQWDEPAAPFHVQSAHGSCQIVYDTGALVGVTKIICPQCMSAFPAHAICDWLNSLWKERKG